MVQEILHTILKLSEWKEVFVVGLSGLDASGKSQLGKALYKELQKLWKNSYYISGDAFHFDMDYSNTLVETDWAHQHMNHSINLKKIRNNFLIPLRNKEENISVETKCFDSWETSAHISVIYSCIYIIESIYLFREDIIEFLDYKIFLDITESTCLKRCYNRARDHELYGDNEWIRQKYEIKNFPGYRLFLQLQNPKARADILIDNNDYLNPKILKN